MVLNDFFLAFSRKLFRGLLKVAFYVSIGTFWKKNIFCTKYLCFKFSQTAKILAFGWNFSGRAVKSALLVSRKTFWGTIFLGKIINFFHRFWTMPENCLTFWQLFFENVMQKTAFSVSQFWEKYFLRVKSILIILAKWAKLFPQNFHWKLLIEKMFFQNKHHSPLGDAAKTCRLFLETFPTGLSKLHCTCHWKPFQNKHFLEFFS